MRKISIHRLAKIMWIPGLSIVFALCFSLLYHYFSNPENVPIPSTCIIEAMPRHAPCLIDLTTGDVAEFSIFQPHARLVGELAPIQQFGFAQMGGRGVGCWSFSVPDEGWMDVTVTGIHDSPNLLEAYTRLCKADRGKLSTLIENNEIHWILADLYTVGQPVYYTLTPGEYDIRDYHITVTANDSDTDIYDMRITSDLFLDQREAWRNEERTKD